MKRAVVAGALLAALTACGDPETSDRRGYTKAPLEQPGILIAGEEPTVMGRMNEPTLPRPPHRIETEEPAAEEDGTQEQEVALAPGVTREQFNQGRQLYSGQAGCQACHGPNAQGTQLGPDLTDGEWLNLSDPDVPAIATLITAGVPQPQEYPAPMPPMGGANLTDAQVQALAGYVASIAGDG